MQVYQWLYLSIIVSLVPPLVSTLVFPRYLIYFLASSYVSIGVNLFFASDLPRSRGSIAAGLWPVMVGVMLTISLVQLFRYVDNIRQWNQVAKAYFGLDSSYSRTLAGVRAIELSRERGFSEIVLIDQHSYTDLRVFRENGLKPLYVNCADFLPILR